MQDRQDGMLLTCLAFTAWQTWIFWVQSSPFASEQTSHL